MFTMIHLKSPKEIETMRGASKIVAEILLKLRENIHDGATTADIDRIAEDLILKKKAKPAFKGYRGFPACLCISVNEQVVHGIPSPKRVLKKGDIVGLDFGVIYDGYSRDPEMTVTVSTRYTCPTPAPLISQPTPIPQRISITPLLQRHKAPIS